MDYILIYSLYVLILSFLMGLSTWKLFKKMGYHPICAFIPFYNYYIILKETNHSKWWAILSYFPIVGPIMMTVFHLFLMEKFGKTTTLDKVLTVFLPFIYMAILNYSKNPEIDNEEEFLLPGEERSVKKKDSFLSSITFAVVFATIVHTFITQPFGIPTGSMENTLKVGDFLFVNKWKYGYRMPMRPLSIPFLQSTIMDTGQKGNPKDDPKAYSEAVKLPYFRIPTGGKPQRYDIVVFNYPRDSVNVATDRKDPYVKRCVGVPGDLIEFRAGRLFINGQPEKILGDEEQQHAYTAHTGVQLNIPNLYDHMGFLPVVEQQTEKGYTYHFQGLTDEAAQSIKKMPEIIDIQEDVMSKDSTTISHKVNADRTAYTKNIDTTQSIFPINSGYNQDWYGPIRVPKKGDVVEINQQTLPKYRWIIADYEHNRLENKGGKIMINGQEANKYTIKQDYYMMIGDNRDASLDARFFGFVPEENIVGSPMFTWLSVEGLFSDAGSSYQANGKKIRWDRMFKATNTGEKDKTSYWWIAAIILALFFGWDYIAKFFNKKNKD